MDIIIDFLMKHEYIISNYLWRCTLIESISSILSWGLIILSATTNLAMVIAVFTLLFVATLNNDDKRIKIVTKALEKIYDKPVEVSHQDVLVRSSIKPCTATEVLLRPAATSVTIATELLRSA